MYRVQKKMKTSEETKTECNRSYGMKDGTNRDRETGDLLRQNDLYFEGQIRERRKALIDCAQRQMMEDVG